MATYEIVLRNETAEGEKISAPSKDSTGAKIKAPSANGKQAISAAAAYGIAKRAVTMAVSHQVNTVELRTGHAELQQRQQMISDIASRSFNVIESIAVGFAVGNVAGAAVGAVTSLAFQGIELAQQMEERQWRMQEESIGISLANIRSGLGRNTR